LVGLLFVPGYLYFGKDLVIQAALACLIASALFELIRLRSYRWFPFKPLYEALARPTEKTKVSGYFYFFLGAAMVLAILKVEIALLAIASSVVGDVFSAIIGGLVGRHRIPGKGSKSFEGAFAGALAIIALLFFYSTPLVPVAAASFTFVELLNRPEVDDNLLHPLVIGVVTGLCDLIL